ncbi:MAG: AEC family transporter [Lautropia sp.]
MNLLLVLFPDLTLIAIGFALSRSVDWGADLWSGIEKLVYYVLFPVLLFHSIVRYPPQWSEARPLALGVLGVIAVAAALGWLARPVLRPAALRHASAVQCAFRFNSYLLLALAQRVVGPEGLALSAVCIGTAVPVCNTLAVSALAPHSRASLLGEWLRNPLIIATVAGSIAASAGLRLSEPVETLLGRLGVAALTLGLLTIGAAIRPASLAGDRWLIGWLTAVKLLAAPLAALGLGAALDLATSARAVLLLFAAVPTAPGAYVLASRMGGDGPFVAVCITTSIIAAAVTLPFWLAWIV